MDPDRRRSDRLHFFLDKTEETRKHENTNTTEDMHRQWFFLTCR